MKEIILTLAIISTLSTGCSVTPAIQTTHLIPMNNDTPIVGTVDQELSHIRADFIGTGIQTLNLVNTAFLIIPKPITFNKSSYDLDPKYSTVLTNVATALNRHNKTKITVSGFAGSNEGSSAAIQKISELRALAVANFLIASNVDADRIEIKGLGDKHPVLKSAKSNRQDRQVLISVRI